MKTAPVLQRTSPIYAVRSVILTCLIGYLTTLFVAHTIQRWTGGLVLTKKLEMIQKEAVVSSYFPKRTEKNLEKHRSV